MRKSYLTEAIDTIIAEGWSGYKISSGKIAPDTKQSKLYKALAECQAAYPQHRVDFVVGGKLHYASQGRHFAVIRRLKSMTN